MGWFAGVLTLIFVVAKLLGLILWSWWLVFAPIWVAIAISLFMFLCIGSFAVWAGSRR